MKYNSVIKTDTIIANNIIDVSPKIGVIVVVMNELDENNSINGTNITAINGRFPLWTNIRIPKKNTINNISNSVLPNISISSIFFIVSIKVIRLTNHNHLRILLVKLSTL